MQEGRHVRRVPAAADLDNIKKKTKEQPTNVSPLKLKLLQRHLWFLMQLLIISIENSLPGGLRSKDGSWAKRGMPNTQRREGALLANPHFHLTRFANLPLR